MDSKQQRIGVIGTGAIGGFYGLMLAHAGHDVHFLLRSEFEAVNRAGLSLNLSLIHISEPTRQAEISYAVFCLKKKKNINKKKKKQEKEKKKKKEK